ncbi:MAG: cyclic lactone autoinducer peptide [Clostridia bacterium]|nr:cyclic lactone autoinducer peptide [Clostridia bacterium]
MKKVYTLIGALAAFIALISASTACWLFLYQPKTPKCLKK